ncbi:hypothetical protein D9M68_820060 [compost metagenome]
MAGIKTTLNTNYDDHDSTNRTDTICTRPLKTGTGAIIRHHDATGNGRAPALLCGDIIWPAPAGAVLF